MAETRTPENHIRAARELLRWDQRKLASESGLSLTSVRRCENRDPNVLDTSVDRLVTALERSGVVFLEATVIGGVRIAGGVAITNWAAPLPPAETRVYAYKSKKRGRPKKDVAEEQGSRPRRDPRAPVRQAPSRSQKAKGSVRKAT